MSVVLTYLKIFGDCVLVFTTLLLMGCNQIENKPIIPIGHYTTLDGNAGLNFRDENHLTLVFNGFTYETQYELFKRENYNEIQIIFELENDTMVAEFFMESEQSIYLKYYKSMKNISHHIDEIVRYDKNDEIHTESINCSSIVLDSIQIGEYFVHFENSLSVNNNQCDTIFIFQPGLTRVTANIDLRNLDRINVITGISQSIPLCSSATINANYCIEIKGFNQLPRSTIESRFNEKVEGDVLMFNVGKVGILIK